MPNTPETWDFLGRINNTASNTQESARIIQLSNGNILVAWADGQDTSEPDIIGQIFDPLGNEIGGEIQLNNNAMGLDDEQPTFSALSGGSFVSAFVTVDQADSGSGTVFAFDVQADVYSETGAFERSVTIVDDAIEGPSYAAPTLASTSNTNAMITYERDGEDVMAQVFNPQTGNINVSEFTVLDSDDLGGHDITAMNGNEYAVVASDIDSGADNDDLFLYVFNAAGSEQHMRSIDDTWAGIFGPSIAELSNGNLVMSYTVDATNGVNTGIRLRILSDSLTDVTGELNPLTTTAGNQVLSSVAALADGGFVVAWKDVDTNDIHAQRYSPTGSKVGSEFDVISYNTFDITNIDIVGLEDGRFTVSWAVNEDIYAETFDVRDSVDSTVYYDDNYIIGTIGNDTLPTSSAAEYLYGHDGNDTILVNSAHEIGTTYDGGAGSDTLLLTNPGTYDLDLATLLNLETIQFNNGSGTGTKTATIAAIQMLGVTTLDFAPTAGFIDLLSIEMGVLTSVNYLSLGIVDFNSADDQIMIIGDNAAESITGTLVDDHIFGNSGSDTLSGSNGDDTLYGGTGNDDLFGGNDDDTIYAGEGADTVYAGVGNDLIIDEDNAAPANSDNYFGGGGTDTLQYIANWTTSVTFDLTTGELTISPGQVRDTFSAIENVTASGSADITGNAQDNILIVDDMFSGTNTLTGNGGNDSLYSGDMADTLYGGNGDDNLYAGSGNDLMYGGSDDDTIVGGDGADVIFAGNGEDTVSAGSGDDTIFDDGALIFGQSDFYDGGDGIDVLDYASTDWAETIEFNLDTETMTDDGDAYDKFANIENLNVAGDADVIGNESDNILFASDVMFAGSNTFMGLGGNDMLTTGAGNDTIYGGQDDDMVYGGAGNDLLYGDSGDDEIYGGDGANQIFGGSGDDSIYWDNNYNLADSFDAGTGNDTLFSDIAFSSAVTIDLGAGELTAGGSQNDVLNFENYTSLQNGHETVIGTSGGNILITGGGDNELYGGGGIDALYGAGGDDEMDGGDGADLLYGGLGADTISGQAGNDQIFAGDGDNELYGGDGSDDIYAGSGNDVIIAGPGVDFVDASSGADEVYGGTGDDTIQLSNGNDIGYGGSENDLIVGASGLDQIFGGDGADELSGGDDADDLRGGEGNDMLDGDAGDDLLYGQNGADILNGGTGEDRLLAGFGNDTLSGGAGSDELYGQGDNDTLSGDGGDDLLVGSQGDDILYGGDDDDFLSGQVGKDILFGGNGNDSLFGQSDIDDLNGDAGDDNLSAGGGDDTLNGGEGNDTLNGGTGSDLAYGGLGDDVINGGAQDDELHGDAGADDIVGNAGNDTAYGGTGNDTLTGQAGVDILYGDEDNDMLFGGGGSDDLFGGAGDDVLSGGGGIGNDELWGDAGADIFDMDQGFRIDRIKDFEDGIDRIDFSGNSLANDFADVTAAASQVGLTVRIELNANNTVILENFNLADLDAADFIF